MSSGNADASVVDALTTAAGGDRLLATQLQLARIDGMLSAVLQGHETRFVALEALTHTHELRLNDKAKLLARLDERVEDLEQDADAPSPLELRLSALETDRTSRFGRNMAVMATLVALPGSALAVINFLRLSSGI